MNLLYHSLAFYLSLSPVLASPAAKETAAPLPCTIRSPSTHAFFDLNPLHIPLPELSTSKHPRNHSWNTTGYDAGYNFTLNFCGGVIEDLEGKGGVVGVEKGEWRNVSAYYEVGGKVYSIGQQNGEPVLRGRKLVLNYTGGSPCGDDAGKRSVDGRAILDDDEDEDDDEDDEDDEKKPKKGEKNKGEGDEKKPPKRPSKPDSTIRRKNTLISFLCSHDPTAPLLGLSYIGSSPDSCTYFFEARSSAGCGGIETAKQTLSPSGVFGVIVAIAVAVYIVGGCVYGRVVGQQRGWRQLPNYGLWAGIGGFVRDIFIILTSSCARFMPSRRGYQRVNGGLNGNSGNNARGIARGRGDSSDAENRLIDELNEEWDD
ncbi:Cation-independent mannose-6-phosphate receptor CI-MPR [Elasticomyces elasticus]|nr:Cation-independent mannose-6-phosphate receptor CI-MPR [Elasticomyces elasticus]KAK3665501.1 Cation-independent mannose-6-phosphate receptor CI-MPR [Elasticomyces elasticus]KAK4929856.1 Cation-independent mannose-6-phosphate receptor CI-MPR [Elasticomyces elasticus]KAK5759443.1 Cation-independent mannose-6-phosphate receptor CI-MPR [Elasticomyces elasticus]